jgi:hypothetical protein
MVTPSIGTRVTITGSAGIVERPDLQAEEVGRDEPVVAVAVDERGRVGLPHRQLAGGTDHDRSAGVGHVEHRHAAVPEVARVRHHGVAAPRVQAVVHVVRVVLADVGVPAERKAFRGVERGVRSAGSEESRAGRGVRERPLGLPGRTGGEQRGEPERAHRRGLSRGAGRGGALGCGTMPDADPRAPSPHRGRRRPRRRRASSVRRLHGPVSRRRLDHVSVRREPGDGRWLRVLGRTAGPRDHDAAVHAAARGGSAWRSALAPCGPPPT